MGMQYLDWHIGETSESEAIRETAYPRQVGVTPSDLDWVPASQIGAGAETVVMEGNPEAAAPFTFRLKFPPHFRMDVHTHRVAEHITVIAGTLHFGVGDTFDRANTSTYPAGSFVIVPAGMPMFSFTGPEGAIVQVHGVGPWHVHRSEPT